jgi:hypothetical protein
MTLGGQRRDGFRLRQTPTPSATIKLRPNVIRSHDGSAARIRNFSFRARSRVDTRAHESPHDEAKHPGNHFWGSLGTELREDGVDAAPPAFTSRAQYATSERAGVPTALSSPSLADSLALCSPSPPNES